MPTPSSRLLDRIRQLIATPSVSSVSPQFDQSNRPVVDLLADWLEQAGFAARIEPLPDRPDKANLIATLGVPVLDGLGPIGGGMHAADEHVDIGSLPDRIALVAGTILALTAG